MARKKHTFTCKYCGSAYEAWQEYKVKRCSEQCAKIDWDYGFPRWLLRTIDRHGHYVEVFKEFNAFEVYGVYTHANMMRGYMRIDGELMTQRKIDIAHLYPVSTEWISPLAAWNLVAVPESINRAMGNKVFEAHCHTGVKKQDGTRIENVKEWLLLNTNLPELARKKDLGKQESGGEDFIGRFKDDWVGVPQESTRITGLPEDEFELEAEEWEQAAPMARKLLTGEAVQQVEGCINKRLIGGSRGRVAMFLDAYERESTNKYGEFSDDGHAAERANAYVQRCLYEAGAVAERVDLARQQEVGKHFHHSY